MKDQASTLRLISSNAKKPGAAIETGREKTEGRSKGIKNIPCLAITSGKGGVGKSNLAVNLALELGAQGSRTMLLDADFGLANADLLCGLTPEFHLGHVIAGLKEPNQIALKLSEKVCLMPGGNGIEELANFSLDKNSHLITRLEAIEDNLDFMLIDTASGIAKNVLGILLSASEVVVVVTPEPTSIVDAYATIKVILRYAPTKPISIIVNKTSGGDAERVFQQINSAVKNFLDHKIEFLGMIPRDPQIMKAVREQTPVTLFAPASPASRAIRLIAGQLHKQSQKKFPAQRKSFWTAIANDWQN